MRHSMEIKAYRLSPLAETDLENIWLYTLENWSREQADSYHRSLMRDVEALASGQKKGRPVEVKPGFLKYLCKAHVIYFKDQSDRLEIIRILHQRQDVERHLQPPQQA